MPPTFLVKITPISIQTCFSTQSTAACSEQAEQSPAQHLTGKVCGGLSGCSLGSDIGLSHTTINHKVSAVDETALVAGKEKHGLGLLDGLTEAAAGEVHLATVALGLVVSEPVLQKRSAV